MDITLIKLKATEKMKKEKKCENTKKGECGTYYPGLEKEFWKSYSDAVLRT